jgi:N-acetylglutamate synthase-like GNAT family acetyltransferase
MATPITLRLAVVCERAELMALQLRSSLNNPGDKDALLANPDAIELPIEQISSGRVFVAECDGRIVGFAAVLPRADGNTELDGLFVEPDAWRNGIGRRLVAYCAEFATSQGSKALHVIGNPHAKEFYAACGFDTVGSELTRFGLGLLMRLTL